MIDGGTQLVGLMGWPVASSISPAMHNAAFRAMGMNWRYVPLPVVPGGAVAAARALGALGFRGANVTAPHKTSICRGLDQLSVEARSLGAVNTIFVGRRDEGESVLVGHNTDVRGFLDALTRFGFDPRGEEAVVVGTGGAARAAVRGLLGAAARYVWVLGRRREQAERLVRELDPDGGRATGDGLTDAALVGIAARCALLVHATPVGMWPDCDRSIWPDGIPFPRRTFAYDLVSVPRGTKLLRQAGAAGAPGLGGAAMLVRQGARAFELWTGREAPIDVMTRACEAALEGVRS